MRIALDATYSVGRNLTGVGMYSREILHGLAVAHPEIVWRWLYRPHRFFFSAGGRTPPPKRRGLLLDRSPWRAAQLFHGLNQRLPQSRFPLQVVTFHDLFVMTAEYSTPDFRARFTEQARHAAAHADRIIAVSRFTAEQVISLLHVDPARVTVIPHGVVSPLRPGIPREKIILHVGAIQKRKNLVRLVRAFDVAPPDWRLVLAGSNGFGAEDVFQAIESSRSRDRITATGYVDAGQLSDWYSRATIFAFPSLDEGFGIPVLEAMAAEVPVIASNSSAVAEVAADAALLVNPESEHELVDALRRLTRDAETRQILIAKGKARSAEFSWRRAILQTWNVYKELLRRND